MHYYKKNIGDYYKKASRLTMLQHGAYNVLIDSCYDRERFPTKAEALEWSWASTKEETEAVEFILDRFFTLDDGLYIHRRITKELENYHKNSKINKKIAIDRETKRRELTTKRAKKNTNRSKTVNEPTTLRHEPPPNQEPLTKNQEPLTNKKIKKANAFTSPCVVEVIEYFTEKQCTDAINQGNTFFDHFTTNGWKVGGKVKTPMKDWQSAIRNWIRRDKLNGQNQHAYQPTGHRPSLAERREKEQQKVFAKIAASEIAECVVGEDGAVVQF